MREQMERRDKKERGRGRGKTDVSLLIKEVSPGTHFRNTAQKAEKERKRMVLMLATYSCSLSTQTLYHLDHFRDSLQFNSPCIPRDLSFSPIYSMFKRKLYKVRNTGRFWFCFQHTMH